MAEDRTSAAAMVEMKTEKLLVLCVNIIWRERRFSVRGRRKSDEISTSRHVQLSSYVFSVPDYGGHSRVTGEIIG